MSPNAVGVAAPFRWLGKAFDVGRRNPKALFGAIALALAVVFSLSLLQAVLQAGAGSGTGVAVVMALGTVIGWLVMPLVFGGLFRVLDATDRGLPVRATDVFNTFAPGQGGKRLVLTNLVYSLAYLALLALLLLTSLGQFFREYFLIALATPVGGEPDQAALVALIQSTSPTVVLWLPVVIVAIGAWMHASMLALATASLRDASVAECVVAGLLAMLRNFFPLMLVSLVVMLGGFVLAFLFVLVVGLFIGLMSMLSPVLGMLLVLPLMALVAVAVYALMFGFYYHGWREIFGEADAAPPSAPGELAA